jgi:hypothetical protein
VTLETEADTTAADFRSEDAKEDSEAEEACDTFDGSPHAEDADEDEAMEVESVLDELNDMLFPLS